MKTKRKLILMLIIVFSLSTQAQIAINTDGSAPDASAMLDVKSDTSGILIPRMTQTQRGAISNPATGLLVYQTDGTTGFYYNSGTPVTPNWIQLSSTLITQLADADNDTKVEVEKNTDEDHIRFSTADTTRIIIDEWGRVGIGTSNPESNLTIFSDEDDQGLTLQTADNSFHQGIRFKNAGGWYRWNIYRRGSTPDLVFSSGGSYNVGDFTDKVTFMHGGAVGIGTSDPDASALLEMESTSKGFLPPRMTETEIGNIGSPANGLLVFNTTDNKVYVFVSSDIEWKEVNYGTGTIAGFILCGDALVDLRDAQSYTTVKIGTQCWMAENLNYETTNSWWYNNSSANGDVYGRLYTWEAALTACPSGWSLPSDEEWKTMEMYLGMSQSEADNDGYRGTDEGGKMKETGTAHWDSPNTGATNSSGFTALPGGYRGSSGWFSYLVTNGYWWSSTEYSGSLAWYRYLRYNSRQVLRYSGSKTNGFSVRCLRN